MEELAIIAIGVIVTMFAGAGNKALATSSQVANISANTTVNVNETCTADQNIVVDSVNFVAGNITCDGGIDIGNITALQNATCTNKQNITIRILKYHVEAPEKNPARDTQIK